MENNWKIVEGKFFGNLAEGMIEKADMRFNSRYGMYYGTISFNHTLIKKLED